MRYLKVAVISIIFGSMYWTADAAIDAFVFQNGTFWDLLIYEAGPYEIYMRTSVTAWFFVVAAVTTFFHKRREQMRAALVESEEKYRMLFNNGHDAVFVLKVSDDGMPGRFVEVNDLACQRLGYTKEELLLMSPKDIDTEESAENLPILMDTLRADGHALVEATHVTKDGRNIPVEINVRLFEYGKVRHMYGIARDISERRMSELKYKAIIKSAMDGFIVTDIRGRFLDVNDSYCRLTGYSRVELMGMNIKDIEAAEDSSLLCRMARDGQSKFMTSHMCKDGRVLDVEVSINYSEEGGGRFIIFLRDITENKRLMDILRMHSMQDGLTGLANRRQFDEILEREWRRSLREATPLAVIMLDIDNFKQFNDIYGHLAGDDCLKRVAGCLKGAVKRPADLVARYGGEEFVALLPVTRFDDAVNVASNMRSKVEAIGIPHDGSTVCAHVTVSAGIACMVPEKGGSSASLLQNADDALYRAKREGRNRVVYS
ncbi:MAG TPA: sensor domain-containing diguanylate cyclase [Nitrospirota bacterium]